MVHIKYQVSEDEAVARHKVTGTLYASVRTINKTYSRVTTDKLRKFQSIIKTSNLEILKPEQVGVSKPVLPNYMLKKPWTVKKPVEVTTPATPVIDTWKKIDSILKANFYIANVTDYPEIVDELASLVQIESKSVPPSFVSVNSRGVRFSSNLSREIRNYYPNESYIDPYYIPEDDTLVFDFYQTKTKKRYKINLQYDSMRETAEGRIAKYYTTGFSMGKRNDIPFGRYVCIEDYKDIKTMKFKGNHDAD